MRLMGNPCEEGCGNRCERVGPRDGGRPLAPSDPQPFRQNKVVKFSERMGFILKGAGEGSGCQIYQHIGDL